MSQGSKPCVAETVSKIMSPFRYFSESPVNVPLNALLLLFCHFVRALKGLALFPRDPLSPFDY